MSNQDQTLGQMLTHDMGVDMHVNMDHIVTIAASRKEREYKLEVKKWQGEVRTLQREIKDSESKLKREARKRGLSWFSERIRDFNKSASALKISIKADVKDCNVIENDQGETVHSVYVSSESTSSHSFRPSHESTEHFLSLDECDSLYIDYWAIDKMKDSLRQSAEKLAENQRALHDLPSLTRQATAKIAEASLSSTEAGRTILQSLDGLNTDYLLGD